MSSPVPPSGSRAALLARPGTLAIVRGKDAGGTESIPELFVVILDDDRIIGFNGHVDLGTGVRTALMQIVAEELDAPFERVAMVLGDTEWAPQQGVTGASETIQITAVPLRCASAQARGALLKLAAERFSVPVSDLEVESGEVFVRGGGGRRATFGELVTGATILLELDEKTPVKAPAHYHIVGHSVPRIDIPAKATGESIYVHDLRIPGMLHGRVVRPPYAGRDVGRFIGNSLVSVDEQSIAHIPGIVKLVIVHDFIGIVAEREDQAEAAARSLVVDWGPFSRLPDLNSPAQAIRENPRVTRKLVDRGDVDTALEGAEVRLSRTYVWPYQMHASIGPSCSVAKFEETGKLTVWSGSQFHMFLRKDLALLFGMAERDVEIIRLEAAGSFGKNAMDDVGADAALLARAVRRPVRVQLTREQEHMWEPKGTAQLMEVDGGLDAAGEPIAYDYQSSYPSNVSPALALLLTRTIPAVPPPWEGGDRTALPPYDYPNLRIAIHDMPPIARASFLRGVSALPTTFAHESYIDELAVEAGVDPVEYRLRHLKDQRAIDLVRSVADRANWTPHVGARKQLIKGDVVRGRGFAYATYVHGTWPGTAAASTAWVVDAEVNCATGEVAVTRVVVGQDSGMVINPEGVRHQVEGNVIQSTSRVLKERVTFDQLAVTSREWGAYPILKFTELPQIEITLMHRPNDPPLGVGESASVPSAAAIANAVYDATGVRFRELPLTPERVLDALGRRSAPRVLPPTRRPGASHPYTLAWIGILAGVAATLSAVTIRWPFRPTIAPIPPPTATVFSAETIEHGRVLAAAGACVVCHTTAGGVENAGGRAIETPFGIIYSTNITPDAETGIGSWSYQAFERAMRQGVSRDGRYLYPVFPYTAFAKISDADLQALYAYLMAQAPVRSSGSTAELRFPFNIRPLLAVWNALFLKPETYTPNPTLSEALNRGAYLVEGIGHCSACHGARNALGAEKQGAERFGGGMAEGWEAPPLGTLSRAPIPWSEQELYAYLRNGASDLHGPAGGAMAPVIEGLRALPNNDIRAMAAYLAALAPLASNAEETGTPAETLSRAGDDALRPIDGLGARLFDGACAVCHTNTGPDLFGARLSLALNSNVHSSRPDNLIRIILDGMADPANPARGAMPAFRQSFDDRQLDALVTFIRRTQAPNEPAWTDLEAQVARIRTATSPSSRATARFRE